MSVISNIWDWIVGKGEVIAEVQPVVVEGEAIVADLQALINDIKAGHLAQSVDDAKKISEDVNVFVAAVEKIVNELKASAATNMVHAQMTSSGRIDRKAKVHNQHHNRTKSPPGSGNNDHHK